MTRILTIEDDAVTAREIVAELSSHGLDVDWVDNGREGLVRAVSGDYDLITLDRMLPELDGLAIVTTLRTIGVSTPILMISALSDVDERVRGLRAAVALYQALAGGWVGLPPARPMMALQ